VRFGDDWRFVGVDERDEVVRAVSDQLAVVDRAASRAHLANRLWTGIFRMFEWRGFNPFNLRFRFWRRRGLRFREVFRFWWGCWLRFRGRLRSRLDLWFRGRLRSRAKDVWASRNFLL